MPVYTEDELAQLREDWDAKKADGSDRYTTARIGDRLGRSKNSVVGKAHRLKLTPRPSPIVRVYGPTINRDYKRPGGLPMPSRRPPRIALPYMGTAPLPPLHNAPVLVLKKPAIKAPPPRPAPERPYGRIVNCCWPISERPYRFCGDTSEPGKPYCANHCRTAYVQRQLRVLEETGD